MSPDLRHSPRINVLHVLTSLDESYGGPLRLVLDLSARAEAFGVDSELVGLGEPVLHDNPLASSKIHFVPSKSAGRTYGYSPQLRKWLAANLPRFDGVVVHGAWTYHAWATARECAKAGVPYAYFPHGMLENWAVHGQGTLKSLKKRLYWQFFESRICRGSRCALFTTKREQDLSPSVVASSPQTCLLRPYGLDPVVASVTGPTNPLLRQPDGMHVALFLGRLHSKKNVAMLIEAWHLARMPCGWRLIIAGAWDEAYQRDLRALVQKYQLEGQIPFVGFVHGEDKTYLLQRAAWFLLPSSQESFGVAVLEAVQNGCAVAISDSVYLSESFRPESEVLPVKAQAWAEFFGSRMQDLTWRQSTRDLDRAHLMKTFEMDQVVRAWAETLTRIFTQPQD